MRLGLGLAIIMTLAMGMGVGSIHNAQARDAIPGIASPFGFTLIFLTLIGFLAALYITRHFLQPETVSRARALGAAIYLVVIEVMNLVSTLGAEGSISGWLFHEYLGLLVAPLLLAVVFVRKA